MKLVVTYPLSIAIKAVHSMQPQLFRKRIWPFLCRYWYI